MTATGRGGDAADPAPDRSPAGGSDRAADPTARSPLFAPAVAAVVVGHHLTTALDRSGRDHTPQSAATAVALLGIARRAGVSWDELGLTAAQSRHGLRVGGIGAAAITGLLAAASLVPAVGDALADGATAPGRSGSTARVALVDIPVNAIMEEVAFRGVLPVALASSSPDAAAGVSTVLFGLWHVLPLVAGAESAADLPDELPGGRSAEVAGTVAATTAAGAVFQASRARSGSLLAPVLLHCAINVGAFLTGRLVARRRAR